MNTAKPFLNLNEIFHQSNQLLIFLSFLFIISCNDDECAYVSEDCTETCETFEDFEDETLGTPGNWMGLSTNLIEVVTNNGSQQLFVQDGSGASYAYNNIDFPKDLLQQGCALVYDVAYLSGSSNGNTTDNSIGVYSNGNPITATTRAYFVLNTSNVITSGNPPVTIEVPLEMASGTSLPSNSYGTWVISPSTTPAADVAAFNALMQNAAGVYFFIDEGANPAEQWWFDNFCFKQCCP